MENMSSFWLCWKVFRGGVIIGVIIFALERRSYWRVGFGFEE